MTIEHISITCFQNESVKIACVGHCNCPQDTECQRRYLMMLFKQENPPPLELRKFQNNDPQFDNLDLSKYKPVKYVALNADSYDRLSAIKSFFDDGINLSPEIFALLTGVSKKPALVTMESTHDATPNSSEDTTFTELQNDESFVDLLNKIKVPVQLHESITTDSAQRYKSPE